MISQLNIYSIPINSPGKLAIISRPRGDEFLDESVEYLARMNIGIVVSALTKEEETELGLIKEEEACNKYNIEFLRFSIEDREIPSSFFEVEQFCKKLALKVQEGFSIGVHCRAGIGRSSILSSCLMIHLGFSSRDALNLISESRRIKVPDTEIQENWINEYYAYISKIL